MKTYDKFTIIFSFKIIEGMENDFINAWSELAKLIYKFAGSYGSRLHKSEKQIFIGYAQWTDKESWKNSADKLPEKANEYRIKMRECCSEIKTEYELNIVMDLMNDKQYNNSEK